MKRKTLKKVYNGVPEFLKNLETYSLSTSAAKAGFTWGRYRQELLQIPEVRVAYDKYIDTHEYSRKGLMGGL